MIEGIPRRLGAIKVRPENTRVLVIDDRCRRLFSIPSPVYKNKDELLNQAALLSESITRGEAFGRWLGVGTIVTRVFTAPNRTITVTVRVEANYLSIEYSVQYTGDTLVDKDGITIDVGIPVSGLMADGDGVCVLNRQRKIDLFADNLDYVVNYVILEDGTPDLVSYSYQNRQSGTTRRARMQYLLGDNVPLYKMLQPSGRLATIILTNHADGTSIESMKAVFYGTSDDGDPEYGTKGFIGNNIKTTWSVFYESVPANIGIDNADFLAVCDDVYAHGSEIVPHRTRQGDENTREDAINHLPLYESHFNSRNWIDHGLGAGARNIGLKSLGWNPESEFYIMDLLQTYGYEYAWAYYDLATGYLRGINMVDPNWISLPHCFVFQNTNLAWPDGTPLWQWRTWRPSLSTFMNWVTPANIDRLIRDFGLSIVHEYFAHLYHQDYFYTGTSPKVIADAFEAVLEYLNSKQSNGSLWIPTMSEYGDYWRKIVRVDIECIGKRLYRVTNNSGGTISGFAMRVPILECSPKIDDVAVADKKTAYGLTIFWIDLTTGEHIVTF